MIQSQHTKSLLLSPEFTVQENETLCIDVAFSYPKGTLFITTEELWKNTEVLTRQRGADVRETEIASVQIPPGTHRLIFGAFGQVDTAIIYNISAEERICNTTGDCFHCICSNH